MICRLNVVDMSAQYRDAVTAGGVGRREQAAVGDNW
jgi:hypothetical protein